jgi:DNA-directed RNA polymerase subunit E'/Rpb7
MMKRPNRPDARNIQIKAKDSEKSRVYGVYIDSMLTKKIILSITEIGRNIKENIQKKLSTQMEAKCIEEGFIRPGSIRIVNYSSGLINTEYIEFQVVFSCKICHPVEGMIIECQTKTITKAGIHAEVIDGEIVPVTIFVARDHHNMDRYFQSVKENTTIYVKVIGIRYELNDPYVCVIGKLMDRPPTEQIIGNKTNKGKARIQIGGEIGGNMEKNENSDSDSDGDSDSDSESNSKSNSK